MKRAATGCRSAQEGADDPGFDLGSETRNTRYRKYRPDIPYTGRESPTLGKQVAAGHRARRWRLRYLSCYDNRMLDSIFSDLQCRRLWSHTMYIAKMY